MVRLPNVGGDDGTWGNYLNDFLTKEHYQLVTTGSNVDDSSNGGHKTITIRAGTTTAGTAPLKFTSGNLLTTAEAGAMEFLGDKLYFTITNGPARKIVALIDDVGSGSLGDIYYRDANNNLAKLPIGTFPQTLSVSSGIPSWSASYTAATYSSGATLAPSGGSRQNEYFVDGLATNITTVSAPSGTPTNGNLLLIRLEDNGTSRTITGWDAIYSGFVVSLPSSTVLGKAMYLGFKYNAYNVKWELIAYTQQP